MPIFFHLANCHATVVSECCHFQLPTDHQEAELLKLGHQLLQNAASKADAKRRSFHQQKVLHATSQLRGMSR